MGKETITFQLDSERIEALDSTANTMDCERSHVLNQAVEAYIETHRWQIEHIAEGLRQADAGEFASDKEAAAFARARRYSSSTEIP